MHFLDWFYSVIFELLTAWVYIYVFVEEKKTGVLRTKLFIIGVYIQIDVILTDHEWAGQS